MNTRRVVYWSVFIFIICNTFYLSYYSFFENLFGMAISVMGGMAILFTDYLEWWDGLRDVRKMAEQL